MLIARQTPSFAVVQMDERSLFRAKINSDYNDFVARVALEVVDVRGGNKLVRSFCNKPPSNFSLVRMYPDSIRGIVKRGVKFIVRFIRSLQAGSGQTTSR